MEWVAALAMVFAIGMLVGAVMGHRAASQDYERRMAENLRRQERMSGARQRNG